MVSNRYRRTKNKTITMSIIKIKVLKDIVLRPALPPLKAGKEYQVASDYGKRWIESGDAEEIVPKKPASIVPAAFAKKVKEEKQNT